MFGMLTLKRLVTELRSSNGIGEPRLPRHLSPRSKRCPVLLLIKNRRAFLRSPSLLLLTLATRLLLMTFNPFQTFLRIPSSLGSTIWLLSRVCLFPEALLLLRIPRSSKTSQQMGSWIPRGTISRTSFTMALNLTTTSPSVRSAASRRP
jgi:hypothetical protein